MESKYETAPISLNSCFYNDHNHTFMLFSQCLYCGKRFVSETYLDKHMESKHGVLLFQVSKLLSFAENIS